MKRMIFVRHGETQINSSGLIHNVDDPNGLTACGEERVRQIIGALKSHEPEIFYSSPEKRAIETAGRIAQDFGLEVNALPEFRERDWGEWSGKTWADVEEKLNVMSLQRRYTFVPPGGESWQQAERRVKEGLRKITSSQHKNIAIVTHGGMLRILMPMLKDSPLETSFRYNFQNCSLTIFDWDGDRFHEVRVNDISHLASGFPSA
ncbi:MAG: histidine phosphatase family protein [Candidatus Sungbacteria bacterium]|nr:histidine phosphatase family protein [Candidatus Sungbacteria bacterium]